jgi:hypothetical protein
MLCRGAFNLFQFVLWRPFYLSGFLQEHNLAGMIKVMLYEAMKRYVNRGHPFGYGRVKTRVVERTDGLAQP